MAVVRRRAPFSDNPEVGPRGQETQQRILEAALRVFDDEGYHQCTIDQIATRAGCSRVAFYQYFGGKEEVFRELGGHIAGQLRASTDALDQVGPDAAGRATLHAWVGRQGAIYERYEPMYDAYTAAAARDASIVGGAARFGDRTAASVRSKLTAPTLAPRQIDPVIALLHEGMGRTRYTAGILRAAAPAVFTDARIDDALADVWHRTIFGLDASVNVHGPARRRPPTIEFDRATRDALRRDQATPDLSPSAARTRTALLEVGREVFVERGYLGTRIDDIATAAGVSHGVFYRYFANKAELARLLAFTAMRTVSNALVSMPRPGPDGAVDQAVLKRWLRDYNAAHASEAAMFRVWVEASLRDPTLETDPAPPLDWGRRQLARFLRPRGFGDVEAEALVLLAVIDAFGSRPRPTAAVEAAGLIVSRGLLGQR
jgi:AcrR family transcriptional regulator